MRVGVVRYEPHEAIQQVDRAARLLRGARRFPHPCVRPLRRAAPRNAAGPPEDNRAYSVRLGPSGRCRQEVMDPGCCVLRPPPRVKHADGRCLSDKMRGGAVFVYEMLRRERGWDADGARSPDAAEIYRRWCALLEDASVPAAWRRQPHLLTVMLRRAGVELRPDELRRARRRRLARLPPSAASTGPADGDRTDAAVARLLADAGAASPERWLASLDGATLRRALRTSARRWGWTAAVHDRVRRRINAAAAHPSVDPEGTYRSHRRWLPTAYLERHPDLRRMPVEVGLFLRRCATDAADAEHLLLFLRDVVQRRLVRLPGHRDARRAVASVCRRAVWVLGLLWRGGSALRDATADGPRSWRCDWLPVGLDKTGLVERIPLSLGASYARPGAERRRWRTTPTISDPRRVVVGFWRGCVSTGVFEPHIPATACVPDELALDRRLTELALAHPERFRAEAPTLRTEDRPELQPEDVEALRRACRHPRETALLELLATTGVRACAVAMARRGDVWDATRNEVRQRVYLREKNSDVRSLVPCPRLRAALHAWLSEVPCDAEAPLFGTTAARIARTCLRTLSRRAGYRRAWSPHQFRH